MGVGCSGPCRHTVGGEFPGGQRGAGGLQPFDALVRAPTATTLRLARLTRRDRRWYQARGVGTVKGMSPVAAF